MHHLVSFFASWNIKKLYIDYWYNEEASENYESDNNDKVGGFEKLFWVPRELRLGLGYPIQGSASAYKDTLVSL